MPLVTSYKGKIHLQSWLQMWMEKSIKAQVPVAGVTIDVLFDKEYIIGGYRFFSVDFSHVFATNQLQQLY